MKNKSEFYYRLHRFGDYENVPVNAIKSLVDHVYFVPFKSKGAQDWTTSDGHLLTARAVRLSKNVWHLVEERTGLSISQGRTLRECVKAARAYPQRIIDRIYATIPDAIARYGSVTAIQIFHGG